MSAIYQSEEFQLTGTDLEVLETELGIFSEELVVKFKNKYQLNENDYEEAFLHQNLEEQYWMDKLEKEWDDEESYRIGSDLEEWKNYNW